MGPQPYSQQTTSGPSASPTPIAASTSRYARHNVVMQWAKETQIKTCKCKICDERVKKFCHRCKSCGRRICSECQSDGFLTIRDMPDSWLPLVNAAAPIVGGLIDSEGFRHAVGFSEEVFTTAETGKRRHPPINRLNVPIKKNVVRDEDSIGLIDSVKLGHWLHSQCDGYGVEFHFSSHPTKVEKDRAGNVTGVRVQRSDANNGKAETLRCSNLVLAAGPFTKSLFSQLFPGSPLHLENHVRMTQWIKLPHAGFGMGGKAGVVLSNVTTEDDTLKGHLGLVDDPLDGVITASCLRNSARATELKQRDALEGHDHSTVALSELAAKYLDSRKAGVGDDGKVAVHGSAYVSTGPGSTPVIGMIQPTLLDSVSGSVGGASIWLCYGFGDFGTTVAPGVGRVVAEMILGGAATVNFSDFAVQKEHRTQND
ncbi:hypothetical protein DOTSEDRAFT_163528 [Dothistroma septosporum NZE10]|uniref:FAD dependent oxidoreductase domain-containing protein n=1 Tax=Dothistroma septosporum (strain NZE10 / CBS 128990) TaxID=675120 RepID=N1Q0T9_DOTSN|nr:hypothetical protein DOTSEDRAFT_163528 [Dothistroma septosporum NZE10]